MTHTEIVPRRAYEVSPPLPILSTGQSSGTLAALARHWRMVASLVIASSLVAYAGCELITPLYSATATVMINTHAPVRGTTAEAQRALIPSEEGLRKNEMAIIESRSLAETVVARLSLTPAPEPISSMDRATGIATRFGDLLRRTVSSWSPWLAHLLQHSGNVIGSANDTAAQPQAAASGAPQMQARQNAVDLFLKRLTLISTDASRVIQIRFRSPNPELAARVANTVADEYIAQKVNEEALEAQASAASAERGIEALNRTVRNSEHKVAQLRDRHDEPASASAPLLAERLSELNRQLADATRQRVDASGRLAEIGLSDGAQGADSASSVLNSPLIQRLQGEAALLDGQLAQLTQTYGDKNPKVLETRAQLRDLNGRIHAETAKVGKSYRSAVAVARANEAALRHEIDRVSAQLAATSASEADVRAVQRGSEVDKAVLMQLAARRNAAMLGLNGPEASVISRATVPESASFPPKLAIIAAAFLFSAIAATIIAVLLERNDNSIRSTVQIRQLTSARMLGAVPIVKGFGSPSRHLLSHRRSQFAENLRTVWFQVDAATADPANILLITSSVPREGKSNVAASLGRMLATAGRKTLVIDADMRNPSVHKIFRLNKSPGLAELLTGVQSAREIVQKDKASGAYFISAGSTALSPAEILGDDRMGPLLHALSSDFEAIVIDSPPILAVHDACLLAQYATKTILVARWGKTKVPTFLTALQRLTDLNIPIAGVALSMVDSAKYGRYGYPDSEIFSRTLRKHYSW